MVRRNLRMIAIAVYLVGVSYPDAWPADPPGDSKVIEGLWSGSWGGGAANGVVFQPAIAELFVKGDHVELYGFRNASRLTGTVRFDQGAKRMQITPAAEPGGQPTPKAIDYTYKIKGDQLTLIDTDKFSIDLERCRVAQDPMANTRVELAASARIDDAGNLVVTEFTVLRAGRAGATYFQPRDRSLDTRQATILVVQEAGSRRITVDEARDLIRNPVPVAIAYRHDDRPSPHQFHELWKDMGPPMPDSDAVLQTFSRTLRPGTLVFILPARELIPGHDSP